MKKIISIIAVLISMIGHANASVSFIGSNKQVIKENPEASTGLDDIFVIYNVAGVSAQYIATSSSVTWYRYSNLGGAYSEPVKGIVKNGNTYTLSHLDSDMGYIIEDGTNRYYFWVVDYSKHYLSVSDLAISPEQECDMTFLTLTGSGDKIIYYTINGQMKELDRDIRLNYMTLEWNADNGTYNQVEKVESFPALSSVLRVFAPLCDTDFQLTGDKFLKTWGEEISVLSPSYSTIAVSAETSATQVARNNSNEKKEEGVTLGGSAPAEIELKAVCTDAVVFKEWQLSTDQEFENITMRINDTETTYTFREQGTTYVRFMASNAAGTCDYFSPTYEVTIGESSIDCPNAFSPGATEGINDEWKVSYKSIISFECYIFNRWGIKVAEFTDPSQGWDGKHGGKLVPAGVYYYVIKATGADGKEYNLKGDINIINYKSTQKTSLN